MCGRGREDVGWVAVCGDGVWGELMSVAVGEVFEPCV